MDVYGLNDALPFVEPALSPGAYDPIAEPLSGSDFLDSLASCLAGGGWASIDAFEFLTPPLVTELAREVTLWHRGDRLRAAGVGRGLTLQQDRSVRCDKVAWLNGQTPPQARLFDRIEDIRQGLNERLFLGLRRFEAHYAIYEPGDFYRRHMDSFAGRASRIVSLVLYLNENWQPEDGGKLQLFNRDLPGSVGATVAPEAGRLVVFMSEEIPHEVLIANRTRYSLACWFRCDDEMPLALND
ncbi:MAG: 2OG-Fe(II) oxygenase [Oleiphilaceae bacterium]|nr:2OG-Fe(II) oxygenase [Oleiphilaceae bacterium]